MFRVAHKLVGLVGVALALAALPSLAHGQETDFSIERFRLSTDRDGMFDVEWSEVGAPWSWDIGLVLGVSDDPLVVEQPDGTRIGALVDHRFGGNLVGSVVFTRWLQLGLDIPLVISQDTEEPAPVSTGSVDSFALGDLRLVPKVELLRQAKHGIGLSFLPVLTLPTSSTEDFGGEASVAFAPELAVGRRFGAVKFSTNLGLRFRKERSLGDLDVGHELFLRAGLGYRFDHKGDLPLELDLTTSVAASLSEPFANANQNHWEILAGAQYDFLPILTGFAGAGIGLLEGWGTPDHRIVVGARFKIDRKKAAPAEPAEEPIEDEEPPAPIDTDGDGYTDDKDDCPLEPEDFDKWQDEDGCPDPDNDGDGILDVDDKCPLEPGVPEAQGCPDPDRDGDTVVDRLDNCPDEPGDPANAGCKKKQKVRITEDRIEILDMVYFRTNKATILRKSYGLLDNVAEVLIAHPEIKKIRVEGHTDDRGKDAYNLDLSQRRAESVMNYLIKKGMPAERLEARGFGETQPVAPNDNARNRARNRRVEFLIIGDVEGVETKSSGPTEDTIDS